ncbi:MAG: hypothetical protein WAO58_05950 [Fimbriimonadaceae bacterium]
MADWLNDDPAAPCDQADQFDTALDHIGGYAASGLDAADFTALAALVVTLRASTDDKIAKIDAASAAVEKERDDFGLFATKFRSMYRQANGNEAMTDLLRGAAGMTIRDTEPSPRDLPEVIDLACIGRPSGNNFLDWSAIGGQGVAWRIETADTEAGPWTVIGVASGTSFLHEAAGAGVARKYRVVPTRGNREGEPSNIAAVY